MAGVLVIDRSKWRRGGDGGENEFGPTQLLNGHGYLCCLGFDALACGIKAESILDIDNPIDIVGAPADYVRSRVYRTSDGFARHTDAVKEAISFNDMERLDDDKREALLIPVLKQLGWDDVQFVDGPVSSEAQE